MSHFSGLKIQRKGIERAEVSEGSWRLWLSVRETVKSGRWFE